MDPDSSVLQVTVTDGRGRPVRDGGLGRWLARVAPARVRGDAAVALVPDARIRELNHRYRRIRAVTDVLSFPAADDGLEPGTHLGDIVIATGVAKRQARDAGHSPKRTAVPRTACENAKVNQRRSALPSAWGLYRGGLSRLSTLESKKIAPANPVPLRRPRKAARRRHSACG